MITRRNLIAGGSASVANGLGRVQPSRFPYKGRPESSPGIGAGPGQNIRARRVVISGPNDSLLVYAGNPAFGNLIASIANSTAHDLEGNEYLTGTVSYFSSGGTFYALQTNGVQINWYTATSPAGPYTVSAAMSFFAVDAIGGAAMLVTSDIEVPSANSFVGTLAGNAVAVVSGAKETWHPLTLANGWANAAGNVTTQYKLVAIDKDVRVIGAINATAATSTTIGTLPPGYQPSSQQPVSGSCGATGGQVAGTTPFIQCDTAGNLTLQHGTIGVNDTYVFNGSISLNA